jgi:hypothetical protein
MENHLVVKHRSKKRSAVRPTWTDSHREGHIGIVTVDVILIGQP